jgi:hypothetical protein
MMLQNIDVLRTVVVIRAQPGIECGFFTTLRFIQNSRAFARHWGIIGSIRSFSERAFT